jgi:hypothetical protein
MPDERICPECGSGYLLILGPLGANKLKVFCLYCQAEFQGDTEVYDGGGSGY